MPVLANQPATTSTPVQQPKIGFSQFILPLLEAQALRGFSPLKTRNQLTVWLGEAMLSSCDIEQARDSVSQGLATAKDANYWYGAGAAQRVLGRIEQTSGNLTEAGVHCQEALATFSSIQARYELARTHLDLASLAHTQNDQDTATTHLSTAYAWFKKLQVPKWAERTEQLAVEYGVVLPEVELDEFETEGESDIRRHPGTGHRPP